MRVGGLRLHVDEIHDGAIVGHKCRGQRQQRVFHPEALLRRLFKYKQHAFLLRHVLTVHQTDLTLLRRERDLCRDLVHACTQRRALQVELRRVLCEKCSRPEKCQG